jgi:CRP/FNR family transcriptional regulator
VKEVNALNVKPNASKGNSPCIACRVRRSNFCGALNLGSARLSQTHFSTRARQVIYRANEPSGDVHVICEGWAACSVHLGGGRRQILSFLLPGDLFSATDLFKEWQVFYVHSLTDLRYCKFNRAELRMRLINEPPVFEELVQLCITEKDQNDQIIISLGQRSAAARIAHLIISLMERLGARGLIRGQTFDFPLRQQHIADAVGLTTVHVSRIINMFREARLIETAQRQIRVVNLRELQRVADAG